MHRALFVFLCVALSSAALWVALSSAASARETDLVLPIQEELESELARERLFDVPFYFHDQEHPAVARRISTETTDRSTRGIFRSDRGGCRVAFLSALRYLQNRAKAAGADAIIEIKSVTLDRELESATEYRCVAGTTIVRVGLKGVLVELED